MVEVNIMSKEIGLRVVEKDDLAFIHQLNNNADIMSYWFEEAHQSMAYLEDSYDKSIDNKNMRQFILTKNDERLGYVALFSIESVHLKAEFAIMIDPKHQGHGYAGIATDLAMDYAFSVLNLHKLYLIADQTNEKAIHVYKKSGFQIEGELKDEYFVNGSYHNAVIMSAFQQEYFKKVK